MNALKIKRIRSKLLNFRMWVRYKPIKMEKTNPSNFMCDVLTREKKVNTKSHFIIIGLFTLIDILWSGKTTHFVYHHFFSSKNTAPFNHIE